MGNGQFGVYLVGTPPADVIRSGTSGGVSTSGTSSFHQYHSRGDHDRILFKRSGFQHSTDSSVINHSISGSVPYPYGSAGTRGSIYSSAMPYKFQGPCAVAHNTFHSQSSIGSRRYESTGSLFASGACGPCSQRTYENPNTSGFPGTRKMGLEYVHGGDRRNANDDFGLSYKDYYGGAVAGSSADRFGEKRSEQSEDLPSVPVCCDQYNTPPMADLLRGTEAEKLISGVCRPFEYSRTAGGGPFSKGAQTSPSPWIFIGGGPNNGKFMPVDRNGRYLLTDYGRDSKGIQTSMQGNDLPGGSGTQGGSPNDYGRHGGFDGNFGGGYGNFGGRDDGIRNGGFGKSGSGGGGNLGGEDGGKFGGNGITGSGGAGGQTGRGKNGNGDTTRPGSGRLGNPGGTDGGIVGGLGVIGSGVVGNFGGIGNGRGNEGFGSGGPGTDGGNPGGLGKPGTSGPGDFGGNNGGPGRNLGGTKNGVGVPGSGEYGPNGVQLRQSVDKFTDTPNWLDEGNPNGDGKNSGQPGKTRGDEIDNGGNGTGKPGGKSGGPGSLGKPDGGKSNGIGPDGGKVGGNNGKTGKGGKGNLGDAGGGGKNGRVGKPSTLSPGEVGGNNGATGRSLGGKVSGAITTPGPGSLGGTNNGVGIPGSGGSNGPNGVQVRQSVDKFTDAPNWLDEEYPPDNDGFPHGGDSDSDHGMRRFSGGSDYSGDPNYLYNPPPAVPVRTSKVQFSNVVNEFGDPKRGGPASDGNRSGSDDPNADGGSRKHKSVDKSTDTPNWLTEGDPGAPGGSTIDPNNRDSNDPDGLNRKHKSVDKFTDAPNWLTEGDPQGGNGISGSGEPGTFGDGGKNGDAGRRGSTGSGGPGAGGAGNRRGSGTPNPDGDALKHKSIDKFTDAPDWLTEGDPQNGKPVSPEQSKRRSGDTGNESDGNKVDSGRRQSVDPSSSNNPPFEAVPESRSSTATQTSVESIPEETPKKKSWDDPDVAYGGAGTLLPTWPDGKISHPVIKLEDKPHEPRPKPSAAQHKLPSAAPMAKLPVASTSKQQPRRASDPTPTTKSMKSMKPSPSKYGPYDAPIMMVNRKSVSKFKENNQTSQPSTSPSVGPLGGTRRHSDPLPDTKASKSKKRLERKKWQSEPELNLDNLPLVPSVDLDKVLNPGRKGKKRPPVRRDSDVEVKPPPKPAGAANASNWYNLLPEEDDGEKEEPPPWATTPTPKKPVVRKKSEKTLPKASTSTAPPSSKPNQPKPAAKVPQTNPTPSTSKPPPPPPPKPGDPPKRPKTIRFTGVPPTP